LDALTIAIIEGAWNEKPMIHPKRRNSARRFYFILNSKLAQPRRLVRFVATVRNVSFLSIVKQGSDLEETLSYIYVIPFRIPPRVSPAATVELGSGDGVAVTVMTTSEKHGAIRQ